MTDDTLRSDAVSAALLLVLLLVVPLAIGLLLQNYIEFFYNFYNNGLEQALIVVDIALIVVSLYFLRNWLFPKTLGAGPTLPPEVPIPTNPEEPPILRTDQIEPGCKVSHRWLLYIMEMDVYPNNHVIGEKKVEPKKFITAPEESIPLKVDVSDVHLLVQECSCPETKDDLSRKTYILYSKTKILWEIIEGEGSFKKAAHGAGSKSEYGDEVIYSPPHIEYAETDSAPPEVKKVKIKVTAYHDDPTKPPEHDYITSFIRMEIHRRITKLKEQKGRSLDEYVYDYWVDEGRPPVPTPDVPNALGECIPENTWLPGTPIEGSITLSPTVCSAGDFVRFEAFAKDIDDLELRCVPSGKTCKLPSSENLRLNDNLTYFWQVSKGKFPLSRLPGEEKNHEFGKEVVWQAPDESGAVTIELLITDSGRQYSDKPLHLKTEINVTGGKAPPPITPPVTPPPVVDKTKEREKCEIEVSTKSSPFTHDVSVSRWWDNDDVIREQIENSIEKRRTWNSEDLGTAVAISDGAGVGATIAAGANIRILEGDQPKFKRTEKISASRSGSTEIEIKIMAPKDAKTGICAAVITALEGHARVLDVPEWLYELLENEGQLAGTIEAGGQIKERAEIIERIAELLKEGVTAGAATAEMVELIGARLVEEIGKRVLLNGKVEVRAEGLLSFKVGTCIDEGSPIQVEASREFEMVNGDLEEPFDKKFMEGEVRVRSSSCSAERELAISLEGEVKVDGEAEGGGDGSAKLSSLWAVAWVAGCEHGDLLGEDYDSQEIYGCKFGGWFTIPEEKLEKYSEDDAGKLKFMIQELLSSKLDEMVRQADVPSPLIDPKAAEGKLKGALKGWLEYVQNEWSLFQSKPAE